MEKEELLSFRREYEDSELKMADFARSKNMEYWKVRYALRKALRYKEPDQVISFKKVNLQSATATSISSTKQILIKTQNGLEIHIPI